MLDTAKKEQIAHALSVAFHAMKEKGYNPFAQLSQYILSEDPCSIPTYQNARALMEQLSQEDICQFLLEEHFNK